MGKLGFWDRLLGRKTRSAPSHGRRSYAAAQSGRLVADWLASNRSADEEIRGALKTLRARSRELCRNNDYAKAFLRLLGNNVIGPNGVGLQMKAADPGGKLDTYANSVIEAAWREWSKPKNASVTRRQSWVDLQRLAAQSIARDGEVILRLVAGFPNAFGFALQVIEADHLDDDYNEELPDGSKIRMGVEINRWGEPVAYHVLTRHPGDLMGLDSHTGYRERVPASEIIHLFVQERPGQTRGVPWMAAPMMRLKMLGGYEEAELVAARVAATKMGFFKSSGGAEYQGESDGDGNVISEAAPGQFEVLPQGLDFVPWSPEHPTTSFSAFCKQVLRGAAVGLGVSYNALASDLEGVTYSSLRQGALEDRDGWMAIQGWLVEHLHASVFERWLEMSMISGVINLPIRKFDKFNSPSWMPRRWSWVDPLKEVQASLESVYGGLKSRRQIIAEQGGDIEDTFEELAQDEALAKQKGLLFQQSANIGAKNAQLPAD